MSPYLAGGIFLSFIVWSGAMYYQGTRSEQHVCAEKDAEHDEAQQKITITAQQAVIQTEKKQQNISQEVSHEYESSVSSIDDLYATSGVSAKTSTAINNMPSISTASCRTNDTTQKYKLTKKQCDIAAQRLISLQKWIAEQKK